MAIEDAQAPRGTNQKPGTRKKDANQKDGQVALFAVETRSDSFDEPGSSEDAKKDKKRSREGQQGGDGTGGAAGFFLVVARKQTGVDGDEGSGKNALAKQILQEIRNAQGGLENVGSGGITKIVCKDAFANEPGNAAEKNPGGYQRSGSADARFFCLLLCRNWFSIDGQAVAPKVLLTVITENW